MCESYGHTAHAGRCWAFTGPMVQCTCKERANGLDNILDGGSGGGDAAPVAAEQRGAGPGGTVADVQRAGAKVLAQLAAIQRDVDEALRLLTDFRDWAYGSLEVTR